MNGAKMKKKISGRTATDEMPAEYPLDHSKSRPNRFASRVKRGRVLSVVLDPDIAEVFHSSEDVNKFLRSVITAMPAPREAKKPLKKRAS